ncbi:transposase [Kitasatospora sp. NBC_00070]|uniref:transposase n=1 Tax=Kitasatospora sp. NBC_00070 TaxID=2975962 RepID=UPI0038601B95
MTDRQAADALRARVGWKFCLSLELADPGCGASMLSEFRARLAQGGRGELLPHPGLADAGYVSVDHILAARAP